MMADKDEKEWIERNEPWKLKKDDSEVPVQELEWFMKLTQIKGIGKETAKDIGNIWDNEEEMIEELKEGYSIPLRNDVVVKLKNYYKEV